LSRATITPVVANDYLKLLLEGDSDQQVGLAKLLKWVDHAPHENSIDTPPKTGREMWRDFLYSSIYAGMYHENRKSLESHVHHINILLTHSEMKNVYIYLTKASLSAKQWHGFLSGAIRAHANYTNYRKTEKEVAKLSVRIATTTKKLIGLLDQVFARGLANTPEEFSSIRQLLISSADFDFDNFSDQIWRQYSPSILGGNIDFSQTLDEGPPLIDTPLYELLQDRFHPKALQLYPLLTGESMISADDKQLAWGSAPAVRKLLMTLAETADSYKPSHTDLFNAATASREDNLKTQYVRAFGYILSKEYGVQLSSDVFHAIALVAGVMFGDSDEANAIPSYEDVRKTLQNFPE
jgi:hypothetical protein